MKRLVLSLSTITIMLLTAAAFAPRTDADEGQAPQTRGATVLPDASPAFIVPLFPQKEDALKNGIPPGMTPYSFWAGRGTMALTKLPDSRVRIEFDFGGLIPHGVYTLWNVLETQPFKDEPLGEFGYGKHAVVADGNGRAHKVVILDKWPGKEFLLDYHADGALSQTRSVYPGALWGRFPPEPQR
jgi:hypothetical protein